MSELAESFFQALEERVGSFDRPINFHVYPFDAGGGINLLTVGAGRQEFVTYLTWDQFGHQQQKRGSLGRFELCAVSADRDWCSDILTKLGRQTLIELFEPHDTVDIAQWVHPDSALQGLVLEEALRLKLGTPAALESCGLMRCIGVTRPELEFARQHGAQTLIERLRMTGVYPKTIPDRASVDVIAR